MRWTGLLFFLVQHFQVIVVGSVVVPLAFGAGVYYGFDSAQFVRTLGAGWCILHAFLLSFFGHRNRASRDGKLHYARFDQTVASADSPSSPIAFITVRTTVISIKATLMTVSIIFALFKRIPPFLIFRALL